MPWRDLCVYLSWMAVPPARRSPWCPGKTCRLLSSLHPRPRASLDVSHAFVVRKHSLGGCEPGQGDGCGALVVVGIDPDVRGSIAVLRVPAGEWHPAVSCLSWGLRARLGIARCAAHHLERRSPRARGGDRHQVNRATALPWRETPRSPELEEHLDFLLLPAGVDRPCGPTAKTLHGWGSQRRRTRPILLGSRSLGRAAAREGLRRTVAARPFPGPCCRGRHASWTR